MPNATNAQIDMDVVINIGDFSVSLYEGEQEILGKIWTRWGCCMKG